MEGGSTDFDENQACCSYGDLGKRVFYFCDFRPLRGLTGVTKFRDFGKFALDQDTFDGYNFFISRDNGIIPIVLER